MIGIVSTAWPLTDTTGTCSSACIGTMRKAATMPGACERGVASEYRIVSRIWPSLSATLMARATPTKSAAASMVSIAFRKCVAVSEIVRPDAIPTANPAIRNRPDSSLKPQSRRSTP